MKYQKYYFATGNKQKIERLRKIFRYIDSSISIEQVPDVFKIDENGVSVEENAKQKVEPYMGKYKYPVLSEDTAVFFEGIEFDPTHVKRQTLESAGLDENHCSQEEIFETMRNYYKNLARNKGGEFDFYYLDGWAILYPDDTIKTFSYKREYIMTDISIGEKQLYFPMCNLYKSKITGKHYMNWNEEDFKREFQVQIDALGKEL